MADSHSHSIANDQSQRQEEAPDEEFRRELRRATSSSPRSLRKSSVCSGPRKTSTSRRASLSPQPLRRLSVVGASDDVPKTSRKSSEPRKPSTTSTSESSPTKTEPSKTVPSKITPRTSHSSSTSAAPLPSPKTEMSKTTSSKTTPRTSLSSCSSPPFDSPTKPGKYTSIDLENDLPEIYSTQLNPALEDPDMSEFFSRPPPFYKAKSPPIYISRKASPSSTIQSQSRKTTKVELPDKKTRMKIWLGLFIFVFFIFPILIILVFRVFPAFGASFSR